MMGFVPSANAHTSKSFNVVFVDIIVNHPFSGEAHAVNGLLQCKDEEDCCDLNVRELAMY